MVDEEVEVGIFCDVIAGKRMALSIWHQWLRAQDSLFASINSLDSLLGAQGLDEANVCLLLLGVGL